MQCGGTGLAGSIKQVFLGLARTAPGSSKTSGWAWLDGTSTTWLYSAAGQAMWYAGEPNDYSGAFSEVWGTALTSAFAPGAVGLNDASNGLFLGCCAVPTQPGALCLVGVSAAAPAASCLDAWNRCRLTNRLVWVQPAGAPAAYRAHCRGDGWALALKADGGSGGVFTYASSLWTNTALLNSDVTALAAAGDAKLQPFVDTPVAALRVVLLQAGDLVSPTPLVLNFSAPLATSMTNLFSRNSEGYTATSAGPLAWRNSVYGGAAYQPLCNREGINNNILCGLNCLDFKARIGIWFNDQNDCISPDSHVGVGVYMGGGGWVSNQRAGSNIFSGVGSAIFGSAYGVGYTAAIAYVYVREPAVAAVRIRQPSAGGCVALYELMAWSPNGQNVASAAAGASITTSGSRSGNGSSYSASWGADLAFGTTGDPWYPQLDWQLFHAAPGGGGNYTAAFAGASPLSRVQVVSRRDATCGATGTCNGGSTDCGTRLIGAVLETLDAAGGVISSHTLSQSATVQQWTLSTPRPHLPASALLPDATGSLTRFVRIFGASWLHFREVMALTPDGYNVALMKATSSTPIYVEPNAEYSAAFAVDGDIGDYDVVLGKMFHAQYTESANTWWMVDLGGSFDIVKVIVWNR